MPRIEEWSRPEHLRILLHGDTGSGKTYLAGTSALVPEMSPILFFDFEVGRGSIYNIPNISGKSIVFHEVREDGDLLLVETTLIKDPGPFKTIIVDSLTEMYGFMMDLHLEAQGRSDRPPQLQDYGFVTNRMMKFLRKTLWDLKTHFIATAGTALEKDELSGEIHQQPDILGKMNYRAGRFFDVVGFVYTDYQKRGEKLIVKRFLQVQPFRRVRAKDRLGGIPPVLELPTMTKIYNLEYRKEQVQEDD